MPAFSEWPDRGLDLEALYDDGWQPVPFDQYVVKIHSRCNLACDYCYMYELADQSWRDQPVVMAPAIASATAKRIAAHARRHELDAISVSFHGGEPLLAGHERIAALAREFRSAVDSRVQLQLNVQTNGMLLTDRMLKALQAQDITVGVSLDGDRTATDRHRLTRRGDSGYDRVEAGLERLTSPAYRHLFAGLLAVIDVDNDPVGTYESLARFAPPSIDLLLPHATWAAPPPHKATPDGGVDATDTTYGEWLNTAFDHWYDLGRSRVPVRLFRSAIRAWIGGSADIEQLGTGALSFLVIETDGAIEQVDSLKVAFEGATGTGLHVLRDELDAAFRHPGVIARQIGIRALSPTCQSCRLRDICGGGQYAHRYKPMSGFLNNSVYCADLMVFLDHVGDRLRADIATLRKA